MKRVLHMIGNAHIDPVWLWRWQDGFSEIRATFRSALERMKEYPEFIFTCAGGSYYEWIERNEPEMFQEIKERVKQGRWCIVGGWWIQPDCNIPCGESFARQALYAQRFYMEKFGVMARTGYNVDSFGHSGSLPKILRMSGMNYYVYMRPGIHEKSYPGFSFIWQSPEGKSVVASRIPFEYCTWGKQLREHIARCAEEVRDENGLMCFYGVGNHGGGPTKENIESIRELSGQNETTLLFSTPDRFFETLDQKNLPVVNGDLLHHASGCYAAHSGVKRWNRQAENRLLTAEKWSVAAYVLLKKEYPAENIKKAWKKALFNQFHDILAGTSILEAYQDAQEDFGYALSVSGEHLNDALQTLAGEMDIPFEEGVRPYVVFNPHGFEARYPVQLETPSVRTPMRLLDSCGNAVPFQMTAASAAAHGRAKLCFVAQVPAMGWQVYRLTPAPDLQEDTAQDNAEGETGLVLENEFVRVLFDSDQGLNTVFFKASEAQMLRAPVRLDVMEDLSDTWSHGVLRYDRHVGTMNVCSVRVIEAGPVLKTIRAEYAYQNSTLTQDYTLYQGVEELFVHCCVNWQETQKVLKMHIPFAYNYARVAAQAPFGYADRAQGGDEYPMQEWVDLTGVAKQGGTLLSGMSVLNDGKYAYSADACALDMTLLRSPYYANHEPFVVENDMNYPVIDRGEQRFDLALLAHEGSFAFGNTEQEAMLMNAPLIIAPESFHAGSLKDRDSFLSLEAKHTVIDAVKMPEDGQENIIIHLHETARQEENITLQLPSIGLSQTFSIQPGQIRVLRVNLSTGQMTENDLIENAR